MILTGIDRISSRHDLIDRSIIITLPFIRDDKRREEKELWPEFEALRPRILGALCDAVSCALRNFENTKLDRLPRMADFARWVTAAEPALPWGCGEFMEAYVSNRKDAVALALDADLVSSAIRQFISTRSEWSGTAQQLLEVLDQIVGEKYRREKEWPKKPNSLSRRLRRSAPFLRANGLEIILPAPRSWRRYIIIRKGVQKIVETDDTVEIGAEQEFAANDLFNDTDNDIAASGKNTVAEPLTGKAAPDKALNDNADLNDKKPTFSKDPFWDEGRDFQLQAEIHARTQKEDERRSRFLAKRR
jgi:hypothetical protein